MKLHEYQSKALLKAAGLPVPKGKMVAEASQVAAALKELGFEKGVVKAQAYTGGRGKAGGVKLFDSVEQAEKLSEEIVGMTLVTKQTGAEGVIVESILLEELGSITRELYLAVTIDRTKSRAVVMLSPDGGMDIEEVAEKTPERILKLNPSITAGPTDAECDEGAKFLGLEGSLAKEFSEVLKGLFRIFRERDGSLLEINPLVVTEQDTLSILDCKFNIDDNALFRQTDTGGNPDAEKTSAEIEAAEHGMSYIQLDGNIGCMVNGAGLAMATMDIILAYGGKPANFLDVGGSATEESVTKAFSLITEDAGVKVILVNIFGGIMQCDVIARGIVAAVKNTGLDVPLVVRLEGTNVEEGKKIIDESGLNLLSATTMSDGAKKAVAELKGES